MASQTVDIPEATDIPIKGKVAIILYGYGLGNSPSLINAAKILAQHNYGIDFFTCRTFLGSIRFDDPMITINEAADSDTAASSSSSLFFKILRFIFRISQKLNRFLPIDVQVRQKKKQIERDVFDYLCRISPLLHTEHYTCLIGVEPLGMLAAHNLSSSLDIPFIYYNMELHYGPDLQTAHEVAVGQIEKQCSRNALFTITQDSARAKVLSRENHISLESILTVPVCASGPPFREKTQDLREMLGVADTKKIILYAGFIAEWAMCAEIASAARSWPDDWVLVFHSNGYNDEKYIAQVKKHGGEKVLFSTTPLPYEKLSHLLASADIGIALYKNLGVNFTLISSASGKIAHYLKSGLPIIVNSYPDISHIIDNYSCGVSVDSPADMKGAIEKILHSYEQKRKSAFICYEEQYEFSRHFAKVLRKMETV